MNLNKILIAIDNSICSEKAAKAGYEIAEKYQAEVALLNIIEPAPQITNPDFTFAPVIIDVYDDNLENSKILLTEIEQKFSKGIKTTHLSTLDTASNGILQQATEWQAGLIVIGTHGRTGINHFLLGSVAESVARKATCPVLIIPNKAEL